MRHTMRFAFQLETAGNFGPGGAKEIRAGGLISTPKLNLYAKQLGSLVRCPYAPQILKILPPYPSLLIQILCNSNKNHL
jgi:hypothetical protein